MSPEVLCESTEDGKRELIEKKTLTSFFIALAAGIIYSEQFDKLAVNLPKDRKFEPIFEF